MKRKRDNLRGDRHLRVGIELQSDSLRVVSIWTVDKPVVQRSRLSKPILIRVELADGAVFLEALDDPRIARSAYRKEVGHSYSVADKGVVNVSVPFTDVQQIPGVRISVMDTSDAQLPGTTFDDLVQITEEPPPSIETFGEIAGDDLTSHPDWPEVAGQLDLPAQPGRFEIFVDRGGEYRWRLRRPDGEIVATSGQGFERRESCEAEIRWIRQNAASVPVVPLDLREGPDSAIN